LYGIDSVMRPLADRETAWQRLAELLSAEDLDQIGATISLADSLDYAEKLLDGSVRGRVIVKI